MVLCAVNTPILPKPLTRQPIISIAKRGGPMYDECGNRPMMATRVPELGQSISSACSSRFCDHLMITVVNTLTKQF